MSLQLDLSANRPHSAHTRKLWHRVHTFSYLFSSCDVGVFSELVNDADDNALAQCAANEATQQMINALADYTTRTSVCIHSPDPVHGWLCFVCVDVTTIMFPVFHSIFSVFTVRAIFLSFLQKTNGFRSAMTYGADEHDFLVKDNIFVQTTNNFIQNNCIGS